jgi:hypothetical protein
MIIKFSILTGLQRNELAIDKFKQHKNLITCHAHILFFSIILPVFKNGKLVFELFLLIIESDYNI